MNSNDGEYNHNPSITQREEWARYKNYKLKSLNLFNFCIKEIKILIFE